MEGVNQENIYSIHDAFEYLKPWKLKKKKKKSFVSLD